MGEPDEIRGPEPLDLETAESRHIARILKMTGGNKSRAAEILGIDPSTGPDLIEVVQAQQARAKTLVELADISAFVYRDFEDYEEGAAKKHLRPVAEEPLKAILAKLESLDSWEPEALNAAVRTTAEELEVGMGKIAQPLRVALTGILPTLRKSDLGIAISSRPAIASSAWAMFSEK